MAEVKWRMKGQWIKNCSCDAGCPCDFNRAPTHTRCEGMLGMNIQEGNYGDVPLSGVKWAVMYKWPGPLHEGNGTVQPFVDAGANPKQREALLKLLTGELGDPFFDIAKMIISKIEEPQFLPIEFSFDLAKRTARMAVKGFFETQTEPIKNPVTKQDHRVQVCVPEGFEYKIAEVGNAVVNRGTGAIKYDWPNGHSSLAEVERSRGSVK